MVIQLHKVFLGLPESLRYGTFSGITSALLSTVVISGLSAGYSFYVNGWDVFDSLFRTTFISVYGFLQVFSFVVWIGICFALVSMSIPEGKKRISQSALFFSNAVISLIAYILANCISFFLLFLMAVLFAYSGK